MLREQVYEYVCDELPPENQTKADDDEQFIYDGCKHRLGLVILLFLTWQIKFNVSDQAMDCLLGIVASILPNGHKMIPSIYFLKKFINKVVNQPIYFCSKCLTLLADKSVKVCPNRMCKMELTPNNSTSCMIQNSVVDQLSMMVKRKGFMNSVRTYRFKNREKGIIKNVYDGDNYQELINKSVLNDKNTVSFAFNTDGVPVFESSKVSMWPAYLRINELPPKERMGRDNIIYCGVWVGKTKPSMWSFLKPLFLELKVLENGVKMIDSSESDVSCFLFLARAGFFAGKDRYSRLKKSP